MLDGKEGRYDMYITRMRPSLILLLSASALLSSSLIAQVPGGFGRFGGRGDGLENMTDEERRAEMRRRLEALRAMTPEQRRAAELDRMLEFTARSYELTDEQKTVVRAEMEKMAREYREKLGGDADELDRLRDRMSEFWLERMSAAPAEGERAGPPPWDDPRLRELGAKMREFMEKHPFDWQASIDRIEKLLPPEQVERARQRRLEFMSGMQQRMQERMDEMARQVAREPENRELFERFAQMRERMAEFSRRTREGGTGGDQSGAASSGARPDLSRSETGPAHPWDAYFADFAVRYQIDSGQRTSGESILKDMKVREAATRAAQADARARAAEMTDAGARQKALAELDAPIDALFRELKTRLDALLTSEQRQKGK